MLTSDTVAGHSLSIGERQEHDSLAVLHSNVQALSNVRWPARVRGLANSEISHVRAILVSARAPALLTTATLAAWRAAPTSNAAASSHAAHLLRRALGVPELTAAE